MATWIVILALVVSCALPIVTAQTSGLSDEEQEEVLRAHNHFRGMVQPVATNMERMEWNQELSYLAQFWASQCEYEENEDRHAQSTEFDYIGQTMGATASFTVNYTVLMQNQWFALGQRYDYYGGTCTDEDGNQGDDAEGCENYVQLVWAKSAFVGCASYRCEELMGAEDVEENGLFVVCYYGPGGNYYGEQPYQTGGESCASCPSDKPYCVSNLCSAESGALAVVSHISLLVMLLIVGASSLM